MRLPTWGEILGELFTAPRAGGPESPPDFDAVRRKYLIKAHQKTGRNIILYMSGWTSGKVNLPPEMLSISNDDMTGLMETIHGLAGENLDLILHSPGGAIDVAEALVRYLRSKFTHIRVIVPQFAMSAATMIACAADTIVMGKHSFLGPIDPQFVLNTPLGPRMVPAQAILAQFDLARRECTDSSKLAAWIPMLSQFGPDLLVQCQHASQLSKELATEWLARYMFRGQHDAEKRSQKIGEWLASHANFGTHSRRLSRDQLSEQGLRIEPLERDQDEQDLFLSVFHAASHTLAATATVKIIENHLGKAFIKNGGAIPRPPGPPFKA